MRALATGLQEINVEPPSLDDTKRKDIGSDENLFDDAGLARVPIDALELGVTILKPYAQKLYAVTIDPKDRNLAAHVQAVRALAAFIGRQ